MDKLLRVLLIEDVEDDAALVLRQLRRGGYEVIFERVETGQAMSAALDRQEWDVAIADYNLPSFGAPAALLLLEQKGPDIPFIIVSGTIGEESAVAMLKAGAHDFVMKNNLTRLVPAIERELREAAGRRERRRAEESLRETNQMLRALVEALPLAVVTLDLEAKVGSWNPAAERIFGWTEEEVRGRPYPLAPDDKQREHLAILKDALGEGRALAGVEVRRQRKDGSPVDLEIWTAPLRDAEGHAHSTIGVLADITRRKQLEVQFRQAQKMEAVGRLASGIAHDFNNVLTAITGHAQLLLEDVGEGDPLRADLEEIQMAADRAASLTRQLLAFTRQQVLEPKVLDLNAVVSNMEKLLKRLIGEDVELITTLASPLGRVQADPGQLEQVVMNLAVNARDAMPGGGKLVIETRNAEIGEAQGRKYPYRVEPGAYVLLTIRDSGAGMDEQVQAHIFEPFFTTKEQGKGTGLGLSTVYGIVKQSGGYIWVDSEVGEGTTFEIYLPRVAGEAERPDRIDVARSRDGSHGSRTILLVEDDEAVRSLAHRVLRHNGYNVLTAANGGEALLLCERLEEPFDLLLTDIVMPDMSGPILAERLRSRQPGMPVLYMSGYADFGSAGRAHLQRGTAFLAKPFVPDILAEKVREMLAEHGRAGA